MGPLAPLLGIAGAMELDSRVGEMTVGAMIAALPWVRTGARAHGSFVPGQGQSVTEGPSTRYTFTGPASQTRSYLFMGPSCFVRPQSTAVPLATASMRRDDQNRPYFMGLLANTIGPGLSLFGSSPCGPTGRRPTPCTRRFTPTCSRGAPATG